EAAARAEPESAVATLRRAKGAAHLVLAAGDLSGRLDLERVTGGISRFADAAVEGALNTLAQEAGLGLDGLFVVALGKHGACELNYSSDIDIAVFYDPDLFGGGDRGPKDAASRLARSLVTRLEERTADGYVFRTDLRLRPDPSSTPLAVSTVMAANYYESLGQNWERMVWIKARACAGDRSAASAFLETLNPFVWRRHMDYWAIADVHAIKRQINAKAGIGLSGAAPDVKLGPGGIREIEFFVQTQQVILGGRDPRLRAPSTLQGLCLLRDVGVVDSDTCDLLVASYKTLRAVEHRIQMINDEQSHTVPADTERRAGVAALCGQSDLETFDRGLLEIRETVNGIYLDLFAAEERRSNAAAHRNLVFTGVDDDPGTVRSLSMLGFADPSVVLSRIRAWHRGGTPATRTVRGRELLSAILPDLLDAMAATGEADRAFKRFSDFFERLRSGVQFLSMLAAEPALLEDLVETLALAPRLAITLSKRPDLLEPLLEGVRAAALSIPDNASFDDAMDFARRYHREQDFLIGHRLLHGEITVEDAETAWTNLAETLVQAMARAAAKETVRRFGAPPGDWCVCALGRLGAREMTAGSDLDLIVVYQPCDGDAPETWFTRFTQRLISALSAPTGEGALYDVDMRLRPSGRAGPVAVRLSAFERYHREEAWTWEGLALTRLRVVAGDDALADKIVHAVRSAIGETRDPERVRQDALDMLIKLHREKPAQGAWDLKLVPGGLVDLEFIVQSALLSSGAPDAHQPLTLNAIDWLESQGHVAADEASTLRDGRRFLQTALQILRLASGEAFDPQNAAIGLKRVLVRSLACDDFDEVAARISETRSAIAALRTKKIGPLPTEAVRSLV
ncbi:MAG: bifunctional [glutamine synthetase] adenylyltransferase/[glutamine synthetase]-adenylyl-L-tyrosine phosphorylase, partial [Pseudomonadota bacterium]